MLSSVVEVLDMIKIGIVGYGNLAKGAECAIKQNGDMELSAVFTRRDPAGVKIKSDAPVVAYGDIDKWADKIDVLLLCGGSATDLPEMSPALAEKCNIVDSFDTHAKIPEHFSAVDTAAKKGGNLALISGGWDPGLFSVNRLYAQAILPQGKDYTFWGEGVSQGHSDAVRRLPGVVDCRQYTVPIEKAMARVRSGENPDLTTREKHRRVCYVVAEDGADLAKIETDIKTMPNYFADYDTQVHFISPEEMAKNHVGLPHGGSVIRSGITGDDTIQTIEYKLTLGSNPQFTGSVLVALARAVYKMRGRGMTGAVTIFDVAPADLSPCNGEELRKRLL